MKLIELHILQSFPVSCLNRDDVGSPKTAVFGGVNRARLSSQSLKRAIREYAQDNLPDARFGGVRGRFVVAPLTEALTKAFSEQGVAKSSPREWAIRLSVALTKAKKPGQKPFETDSIETVSKHLEDADAGQVTTALFMSPKQIALCAQGIAAELKANGKVKSLLAVAKAATVESLSLDAVDVALFGRMVAADSSLTVEGAAMFSHALSTHKSDNDLDFFSAFEEFRKPDSESSDEGAAMIGTSEHCSPTYYRYAAVNLDLLADKDHLAKLSAAERRKVVDAFIRATLQAVPGARKNSMNAHTLPGFVLGTFKAAGQPVQLINAFENPVRPKSGCGLLEPSVEALKAHHAKLKDTWGITCETEVAIPDVNLNAFCEALTQHVH